MTVQRLQGRRIRRGAGVATCAALALACVSTARAETPSLLAQWRFDEPAGQVALDDGPFGLDGMLGTAAAPDAADPQRIAGASGGALHFDGSDTVSLPNSSRLTPQTLSVEAVVRAPASPGRWRYVIARGGNGCWSGSYGLYTGAAGGISMYVFDGSGYVVSPVARISDVWNGDWHHVAGVFDGHRLWLYLDGRQVGEPLDAPLHIDYRTASQSASIGQYPGGCDLPFVGDIDLVRLTQGALGPDTIARNARAGVPGLGAAPALPLPPAAPGEILPVSPGAASPPSGGGGGGSAGTPPRCVVKLSRSRMPVGRRTVVRASVTPARRATLLARAGTHRLAKARATAKGVARLVITPRHSGRLTVSVSGRASCTPARLLAAMPKSH